MIEEKKLIVKREKQEKACIQCDKIEKERCIRDLSGSPSPLFSPSGARENQDRFLLLMKDSLAITDFTFFFFSLM